MTAAAAPEAAEPAAHEETQPETPEADLEPVAVAEGGESE
jgi:hypothetical protein